MFSSHRPPSSLVIHPNHTNPGKPVPRAARRGVACLELALLLPLLMFLFVIAVDFGRAFYFSQTVAQCARNGALYESDQINASESPYANCEEAARAGAPVHVRDSLTVNKSVATDSAGEHVIVTVSYPFLTICNYPGVPDSVTLTHTVKMRQISLKS